MEYWFYNVTYTEIVNGEMTTSNNIVIRAIKNMKSDDIKAYIRSKINKPNALLALPLVQPIDEGVYLALRGEKETNL